MKSTTASAEKRNPEVTEDDKVIVRSVYTETGKEIPVDEDGNFELKEGEVAAPRYMNPKKELEDMCRRLKLENPTYGTKKHGDGFVCTLSLGPECFAKGAIRSNLEEAERSAAAFALDHIREHFVGDKPGAQVILSQHDQRTTDAPEAFLDLVRCLHHEGHAEVWQKYEFKLAADNVWALIFLMGELSALFETQCFVPAEFVRAQLFYFDKDNKKHGVKLPRHFDGKRITPPPGTWLVDVFKFIQDNVGEENMHKHVFFLSWASVKPIRVPIPGTDGLYNEPFRSRLKPPQAAPAVYVCREHLPPCTEEA